MVGYIDQIKKTRTVIFGHQICHMYTGVDLCKTKSSNDPLPHGDRRSQSSVPATIRRMLRVLWGGGGFLSRPGFSTIQTMS